MPSSTPLGWQFRGACQDVDPELFFPHPTETERIAEAKAVCADCPVRSACLEFALSNNIQFGIFAGRTEGELKIMRSLRARQTTALESWQVEHGTRNGARWHYRHGETPCGPCKQAIRPGSNERWTSYNDRQKANAS